MRGRRKAGILALLWAILAVGFILVGNGVQTVVAMIASLVAFLLVWWYTNHNEPAES